MWREQNKTEMKIIKLKPKEKKIEYKNIYIFRSVVCEVVKNYIGITI